MGPTSALGTDTLRAQWNRGVCEGGGLTSLSVQGRSGGSGGRRGPGRYWSQSQISSPEIIQELPGSNGDDKGDPLDLPSPLA